MNIIKFKYRGMLFLSAVIMSFIFISITTAYLLTVSTNLQIVTSNGDMLLSRRYADIKKNEILLSKYDDLPKVSQKEWKAFEIDRMWEYKITISDEKINKNDGERYKIVTIYIKNKKQNEEGFETKLPIYKNSSSFNKENTSESKFEEKIMRLDSQNSITFKQAGFVVYNTQKCSRAIVKEVGGKEYVVPDSTIYPVAENEKFILQGCSSLTDEEKNIVFFASK